MCRRLRSRGGRRSFQLSTASLAPRPLPALRVRWAPAHVAVPESPCGHQAMIRRSTRRPVGATRPAEVSSGPTCRPARRKATATESPASTTLSTSRSGRSRASCISRARATRSTAVSETPLTVTGSAYSSRKAAAAAPLFLKKRICPQPQQLLNAEGHRSMVVPTAAGHQTALRCRPVERLGLERGGDRGPRGHRSSTATGKPQPAGVRSVGLSMYQVAPRTQQEPPRSSTAGVLTFQTSCGAGAGVAGP